MKVGIDITQLHKDSKQRGIGFYTQNLIEGIRKYTKEEVVVIENPSQKKQVDIIHYPYFDLFKPTLKIDNKIPTVVTIHDVTPLVFPRQYPPGFKGRLNFLRQRLSLRSVKAIITDSENSKKDIIKYLGINEDKIYPIYLAPGEQFKKINDQKILQKIKQKYLLPDKFLIYSGSVNYNKNLNNMAEAAIKSQVDLVLVGRGFETTDNLDHIELKSFKEFKEKYQANPKIHILGFVPDEDLVGVINLASGAILVSLYEGFGLPVLEAQGCGVAVITSDISSMPEVVLDSAIKVNPENITEIEEAIKKLMDSEDLRKDLISKGTQNLTRFSWKKVAEETLRVYTNVSK